MTIYELTFWDSEADDRRGAWTNVGRFFRSKKSCQEEANRLNNMITELDKAQCQEEYHKEQAKMAQIAREHNALVAAGLRDGERVPVVVENDFHYDERRIKWLDKYGVTSHTLED